MISIKPSIFKTAFPLLIWFIVLLIPVPPGLQSNAWQYFALFTAVIVTLILEPIPAPAIGFMGVTVAIVMGYISDNPSDSLKWGLSGFSNSTVWLIFGAFMLSMGYKKSGLGRRLALVLVRLLGKRTLGLGYAIALADLLLAPATPSNTARSAGTIYPIIDNIPHLYGSEPGPTAHKIGSYIMWTAFAATAVTSSMFLTGLAPNLLALSIVEQTTDLEIQWVQWFLGFLPMGVILLSIVPYLVYKLYPPEIKKSGVVIVWASQELRKMGKLHLREFLMAGIVVMALSLWIFGRHFIHATTVVWIAISCMLLTRIIQWQDILENKAGWGMLVWFATLVALADGLKRVGFIEWISTGVSELMTGFSPLLVMAGLVVFFFFIHYMFASLTAHTTALLPIILAIGKAIPGVPPVPLCLLLCYSLGLMGVLTPYATGPAPVYYGSGYITRIDFWRMGFIFGLFYLIMLLAIGIPYLTMIL